MMAEYRDCRALDEEFLEMLTDGYSGDKVPLYSFVKLVKDHQELAMCFRGNANPQRVIIYRNNHKMFEFTKGTVYFNPNYLRYCPQWETILETLYNYGYGKGKKIQLDDLKQSSKGFSCSFKTSKISAELNQRYINQIESIYNVLNTIFDQYFSKEADFVVDQFLLAHKISPENMNVKNAKIEKIRQQQLFNIFKCLKNGYFFYDMEFQQKHKNKKEQDEDKNNGKSNKPDMLALRFDNSGDACALVFVEVKCTEKAYDGKSSLEKHVSTMQKYSRELLPIRKEEARLMIDNYKRLGLFEIQNVIDETKFENLKYELLLVFTDSAVNKWTNDTSKMAEEIKKGLNNQIGSYYNLADGKLIEAEEIKKDSEIALLVNIPLL